MIVSGRCGGRVLGKKLSTVNGTESFDLGGQWIGRLVINDLCELRHKVLADS